VTPDHYVVDRIGVAKLQRLQHGGAKAPVLRTDELQNLAQLGTKLEEHFGSPQDIEWAIEDETIYLLQSRPITTA
jgi:pyruvate,water dikinase